MRPQIESTSSGSTAPEKFPIPMRGNEVTDEAHIRARLMVGVSDPHEG